MEPYSENVVPFIRIDYSYYYFHLTNKHAKYVIHVPDVFCGI